MFFYYIKGNDSISSALTAELKIPVSIKAISDTSIIPYSKLYAINKLDPLLEKIKINDSFIQHPITSDSFHSREARFPRPLTQLKGYPFHSYNELTNELVKPNESINLAIIDYSVQEGKSNSPLQLKGLVELHRLCTVSKTPFKVTFYSERKFKNIPDFCKVTSKLPSVKTLFQHNFFLELESDDQTTDPEYLFSQLGIKEVFSKQERETIFNNDYVGSPERHLLIAWKHALPALDDIRDEIQDKLSILGEHEFSWADESFDTNMLRFYDQPERIIKGKINRVGRGDFVLFIVEDRKPAYDYRKTSRGAEYVNTALFDLKTKLRKLTALDERIPQRWPDLIHTTNSTQEYLNDFILLFGFNAKDYDEKKGDLKTVTTNLIGEEGWNSFEELFDCMNNCLDYVIMRNWQGLPDQATIKGHDDIDFLVESLSSSLRVLKAKKVFPHRSYRVHCEIQVGGKPIRIDLRAVGDHYYPIQMQKRMLSNKVIEKCFYVPNNTDHFYSLAYHALIHKNEIGADYIKKLQELRPNNTISKKHIFELLAQYMADNKWSFTKPEPSVKYCLKHIFFCSLSLDGQIDEKGTSQFQLTEDLYIKKTPNAYTKFGILEREIYWLEKLKKWNRTPNIIRKDSKSLTIEYAGQQLNRQNLPKDYKKQIQDIIAGLKHYNCSHNDIWTSNLLVDKGIIKIIDFQWATKINEPILSSWPRSLGESSRFGIHNFIDEFSIWLSIKKILENKSGRGK